MPIAPHTLLVLLMVIASLALMLVRPRGVAEAWWVGGGAILLVVTRLIPARLAFQAVREGTDVYLFLIGMMLLSALAEQHGVFDWLAAAAVRRAGGSSARLFTLLYAAGTLVTITMSNDATAVVLTPAVLAATARARVRPLPHVFACALIANAASFVLPISNPANLVVFRTGMPPLAQWLSTFFLPSLFSIAATFAVLRWRFRGDLAAPFPPVHDDAPLPPPGRLVLAGLVGVIAILLIASQLRWDLGLPTCIAAVLVAGAVSARARTDPRRLLSAVSWSTLLLVAGLFVLVDAVESLGATRFTTAALRAAQTSAPAVGAFLVSAAVAVGNNLVNNLPLGLLAAASVQAAHVGKLLSAAVLIGVDVGPNLSVTGSLATILWLIALRREGIQVSAWDFLKTGAIAMPAALVGAMLGLLLTLRFAGS